MKRPKRSRLEKTADQLNQYATPNQGPPSQQETVPCVSWDVYIIYDRNWRTGIQVTFQTSSWTEVVNYFGKVKQPEEHSISVGQEKVFMKAV